MHARINAGETVDGKGGGGKGEETTSPNSLARTHARSIVPAGSHFVLARRPDILSWESTVRDSFYPSICLPDYAFSVHEKNPRTKRYRVKICIFDRRTNFLKYPDAQIIECFVRQDNKFYIGIYPSVVDSIQP